MMWINCPNCKDGFNELWYMTSKQNDGHGEWNACGHCGAQEIVRKWNLK